MEIPDFKISIVIPCFNEEGNILELYRNIYLRMQKFPDYEFIFVDDGSQDATLTRIKELSHENNKVNFLSLSRNFGHQNALKAGLDYATGQCVISMDADLQHPPELISQLIQKWQEGYDVVYTIRLNEKKQSLFKKLTSKLFYRIINSLSSAKIEDGTADFRLLDRKVVDTLKKFNENYLFIRGLISWVGFKQTSVSYYPNKRFSGVTKYSFRRMVHFASSGITSFSTKPLKLSICLGFCIALASFLYALGAIYLALFTNKTITGWTSVIVSILFIGGIQLIMIGLLGEYLGKLFIENKRRPNYIIKESTIEGND